MGKTRVQGSQKSVTLDAGALIALDRGDKRMIALLEQARAARARFRVPAGVLGQVWRGGGEQALIARFLRLVDVEIRVLDEPLAKACGALCSATGTRDVIDASVVLTARERGDAIVSSDPVDIRRLDPAVFILAV